MSFLFFLFFFVFWVWIFFWVLSFFLSLDFFDGKKQKQKTNGTWATSQYSISQKKFFVDLGCFLGGGPPQKKSKNPKSKKKIHELWIRVQTKEKLKKNFLSFLFFWLWLFFYFWHWGRTPPILIILTYWTNYQLVEFPRIPKMYITHNYEN